MMGYGGFGLLMGGLMMLPMMLVWILPIALIVWLVSSQSGGDHPSKQAETPLEILRRRYASGEISKEEFEQAGKSLV